MRFFSLVAMSVLAFIIGTSAHATEVIELITNGGFEAPALASSSASDFGPSADFEGNFVYPTLDPSSPFTIDGWTYAAGIDGGASGLIDTSQGYNAWYDSATPPSGFGGVQFAFIQEEGTLSQTFTSPSAGAVDVSWLEAGRPFFGDSENGDQTYEVELN